MYHLHARRIGPFPPRIRDVGVTLDLASHDIDVMRYLANAEIEHMYAQTQRRLHSTCEDLLIGFVRFTNDVLGVLDVNWLTHTKIRELTGLKAGSSLLLFAAYPNCDNKRSIFK